MEKQKTTYTRWPLYTSLAVYCLTLSIFILVSIRNNEGHFVYPLDDPYIHMAIAKNVVLHGVWGVTQYGFSSSTSSPLWTVLVTLSYVLFGINEVSPFIMNFLFGVATIFSADFLLKKQIHAPVSRFLILCLIIFAAPLPTLTFISMEHTLHGLLNLWFVYLSAQALYSKPTRAGSIRLLAVLSFFLTISRYEGLFAVFIVCVLFLLKGEWKSSFLIDFSGLLPIVLYGFWSVSNGWYFIPNSILMKANTSALNLYGDLPIAFNVMMTNILYAPHLVALLIVSSFLLYRRIVRSVWSEVTYLNIIFIAITLLQIIFARVGWLFRYEAYLLTAGIPIVFMALQEEISFREFIRFYTTTSTLNRVLSTFMVVFSIATFVLRIAEPLRITARASTNYYQQQYQMARFLKQYYPTASVAVNDIGAISYYTEVHLTDLAGLGSIESARAKLRYGYSTGTIRDMAEKNKVSLAIVYESWFLVFGGVPSEWQKVGEWEVQNNVVLGDSVVSFFAVDPAFRSELKQNLREFSPRLPREVIQYGAYLEGQ